MSTILGRFSEYLKLKTGKGNGEDIEEAIETYLDQGGILRMNENDGKYPELIYPGKKRIKEQLEDVKRKEKYLSGEIIKLRRKKREKDRDRLNPLKKSLNPTYWKHVYKKRMDEDYKEAYEEIKPPMEKVNDSEWNKMLKMFVKEEEYRKRLLEASRSEIAKGKGTMSDQLEKRNQFSKDLVDKRINKLQNEIDKHIKKKRALKKLLKIAKR